MSYKRWVVVSILLFGIGIGTGLLGMGGITDLLGEDLAAFQEQLSSIWGLPMFLVAILIFLKNVLALATSFVLSPLLCLVPVLALTVNGWLIGVVSSAVVSQKSLTFLLSGLIPHGIFELPAFIMGEAAALNFGTMAVVALFKKDSRYLLIPNLKQNLKYLAIALALLVPAAIIETFITPLLLT
ncbi:stage II sporulation protein M [Chloroflexota bacterium]